MAMAYPPLTQLPPPPPPHTHQNNSSSMARLARRGLLSSAASAFSLALSNQNAEPDDITLLSLLSACADFPRSRHSLPLGLSLHARLLKLRPLLHEDIHLSTALVDLYSKHSLPSLSRKIFNRMPNKSSFSFNTMIAGHMQSREVEPAVLLFHQMRPSQRDKVTWTALIDGLVKNGLLVEAIQHFQDMQLTHPHIEPDYVMLITLVSACAALGALSQGMWVHRYSIRQGLLTHVRLANSFIDMYARCGRVDLAHEMFLGVGSDIRTRVTWNSIIVGFAINGCSVKALEHFALMQKAGFEPDGVTFTGVLTACSHAGLVDEGLKYYKIMQKDKRIPTRIEHYGCIVDLLARAGQLKEAMSVVESMMLVMRPNEVVLGSLLAACRVHGDVKLAEKLMGYLTDLEPETDSNYVLLSNIYAAVGKWDGAGKVRNMMKSLGVKKRPGFSMVEVDGAFHEFVAGDKGHPQKSCIYDMLNLLCFDMKLHAGVR